MREKFEGLSLLGSQGTKYNTQYDPGVLEVFENKHPGNDYFVKFNCPEFTSLCPMTGQPDFAILTLDYVPDRKCVELKSLKEYIWSFRDTGAFHEAVTNRILNDIVSALSPRHARLKAQFNVRGGIFTTVVVSHSKRGWKPSPALALPDNNSNNSIGD